MPENHNPARRPRVTYANVVATLALVVALGGTSYAAAALPRNSVGTPQLKTNAVTSAKIGPGGVTTRDVRRGAVTPDRLSAAARALARRGPVSPATQTGSVYDVTNSSPNTTVVRWGPISGNAPYSADFGDVATVSPNRPLVARSLSVRLFSDLPEGATVRVEVVRAAEFADPGTGTGAVLSCLVTGTDTPSGPRTCTSAAAGVIPARSVVFVRVSVRGGFVIVASPTTILYGFTLEPQG